jgi:hypothetical protein
MSPCAISLVESYAFAPRATKCAVDHPLVRGVPRRRPKAGQDPRRRSGGFPVDFPSGSPARTLLLSPVLARGSRAHCLCSARRRTRPGVRPGTGTPSPATPYPVGRIAKTDHGQCELVIGRSLIMSAGLAQIPPADLHIPSLVNWRRRSFRSAMQLLYSGRHAPAKKVV